jgi:hypothetical protein
MINRHGSIISLDGMLVDHGAQVSFSGKTGTQLYSRVVEQIVWGILLGDTQGVFETPFWCREQAARRRIEQARTHLWTCSCSQISHYLGRWCEENEQHGGQEKTSFTHSRTGSRICQCSRVSKDTNPVHSKPRNVFAHSQPIPEHWRRVSNTPLETV